MTTPVQVPQDAQVHIINSIKFKGGFQLLFYSFYGVKPSAIQH